jgi:CHRD domain
VSSHRHCGVEQFCAALSNSVGDCAPTRLEETSPKHRSGCSCRAFETTAGPHSRGPQTNEFAAQARARSMFEPRQVAAETVGHHAPRSIRGLVKVTGPPKMAHIAVTLTVALQKDFTKAPLHVNVHTAKNPNGEIRGQLAGEPVRHDQRLRTSRADL